MLISTKSRYAVMAMVYLAQNWHINKPFNLVDVANAEALPLPYLEQLFRKLKKAKLVKSVRGPLGGYVLAKNPDDLKIADVIWAVDAPVKSTRCKTADGCLKSKRCKTHNLWAKLDNLINSFLGKVTLADVCNDLL